VDEIIYRIYNQTSCPTIELDPRPFPLAEWMIDTLSFIEWENYCNSSSFSSIEDFVVYLLNNETEYRCPSSEVYTFQDLGSKVTILADYSCTLRSSWTWPVVKVSSFLINSIEKSNQEITDLFAGFGGAWAIISLTLSILFVEIDVKVYRDGYKRPQIIFRHRATPEYVKSIKTTLQSKIEKDALKKKGQVVSVDETYSPFIRTASEKKSSDFDDGEDPTTRTERKKEHKVEMKNYV